MHASGIADITIASVQSITSGDRISKFDPKRFKLILVDEAHHIVAPGYMKTLAHFGLADKRPLLEGESGPNVAPPSIVGPALVGVSATFSRFDGLSLGAAIDRIVYHKDYVDMIGEKWLSDVIFTTVETKADISKVKTGPSGDFQAGELSRVLNTQQINDTTVKSWLARANGRKSTLVFCSDLAHVTGLTNTFRIYGIDARFVTGDTPKAERSARLDAFRAEEFPVLVNCGVFTEGTDVPNIDCVLLARPTKSRNLLVQMIGRGMRLHPGKQNCHIIDMVSSLATGIVTTPTLFGLDPSQLVQDATVEDLKSMQNRKEVEKQRQQESQEVSEKGQSGRRLPQTVTFTYYNSVFDLIEDTSIEKHIRSVSPHSWVDVGDDRYILTAAQGKYLKLEKEEDNFIVSELVPLPRRNEIKAPYRTPREIARTVTFQDAVHAADTYASAQYPRHIIGQRQVWRKSPATESQLAFLNKLRTKEDRFTSEDITKGKAGDMITKIKHGARGRFARMKADQKRQADAEESLRKVNTEQEARAAIWKAWNAEQEQVLKKKEQFSAGNTLD